MDISSWLRSLDLERYERAFREGEIDFRDVSELTDADLKDLGIAVGPRRRLLKAIRELGAARPTAEVKPTSFQPAPQPRDTAERRQLTVMFCDLVGSTALSAKMDPEDLREVISAYQAACTKLIETHDGLLAKFMGDGILAYYGYPRAHEDDAERAVRAGLDIIRGVSSLTTRIPEPLQVRIGIATGLVVVGDLIGSGEAQERGVVGETPNLAARLQSLATPNSIVIGSSTRRILGDLFEYEDLGRIEVKGFDARVQAYQVLGLSSVESRFEALRTTTTPLVGRDEELDLLMRRWEQAKEGDGQVVLICGEPGIGKSRITQAIQDRLGAETHTRLRYFCSPHHRDSALYPIITQLERAAGFRRDDTNEQRLGKLETTLARAVNDLSEGVPLLAELLCISTGERYPPLKLTPQKRKEKTLKTLLAQVEGLGACDPVLMMFEDVHWVDPTTRESLDLLVDRASVLRVLVIVTFRPEFTPPWIGRPQVTLLTLDRLPPRQRADMITKVVRGKALPKEIAHQIIERTDGIPLFIEELTKAVIESGVVAEVGEHYEVAGPLTPLAIPTSLHASLLARLDRLAPVREVAQIAAALGRQFSHELISAVAGMPQQRLDDALSQLVASELIFRRGTPPDAEYTFKHALVQDAAYTTLLRSKRVQLHSQIGMVLEAEFLDTVAKQPELLAHHFTEAGLYERAVPYWTRAGERALEQVAFAEAVGHLTTALTVNERLPGSLERDKQELQIRLLLASAYYQLLGWAAVEVPRTLRPAHDLALRLGESEKLLSILYYIWVHHGMRCEYEMANGVVTEVYAIAKSCGDSRCLITAQMMDSSTCCWRGDFTSSRQVGAEVVAAYDPSAHSHLVSVYNHDPKCIALIWSSIALWSLGYPDQALQAAVDQLAFARKLGHIWNLVFSLTTGGSSLLLRGDTKLMLEWCAEARAIGSERAIGVVEHFLYPLSSRAAMMIQGEYEEGYASVLSSVPVYQAVGGLHGFPMVKIMLALGCLGLGKSEQAEPLVREAIELIDRTGHCMHEAEAYRALGEVLWARGDPKNAETAFTKGIEISKSQHAKSWELRTAISYARLMREQGREEEAYQLLAPVYDWFSEGFDTKDLKEAKGLLSELR